MPVSINGLSSNFRRSKIFLLRAFACGDCGAEGWVGLGIRVDVPIFAR
jgi:hypothetical protein